MPLFSKAIEYFRKKIMVVSADGQCSKSNVDHLQNSITKSVEQQYLRLHFTVQRVVFCIIIRKVNPAQND